MANKKLTKKELVEMISFSPLKVSSVTLHYNNIVKLAERILDRVYGVGNWREEEDDPRTL